MQVRINVNTEVPPILKSMKPALKQKCLPTFREIPIPTLYILSQEQK